MKNSVICIGQSVLDVQIKGIDFQQKEVLKEAMMADKVQLSVGGDATNQSIVLSRLDINSKLVSGIGDDAAGMFLKFYIDKTDVDTDDIVVVPGSKSPVSIVVIDKEGERSFIFSGMETLMRDSYLPNLDAIKGNQVVSLGSMFGSPLSSRENIEQILTTAKRDGALVCADIIVSPGSNNLEKIKEYLGNIDFLFPNEDEARLFTGKDTLDEIADHLLGFGVKHVLIKRGKEGCFLKTKSERLTVPAYIVNAIDTTGAGDNFVAGFITALLDQKSLYDCCRFGSATAAVNILEMGANSGVRSKEQVIQFMEEHSTH